MVSKRTRVMCINLCMSCRYVAYVLFFRRVLCINFNNLKHKMCPLRMNKKMDKTRMLSISI